MSTKKELEPMFQGLVEGRVDRRQFVVRMLAAGASMTSLAALLEACSSGGGEEAGTGGTAPLAEGELPELEKELVIYNWSDYIAEDTVAKFEEEFKIKVTYQTYESNEEMLAKLQVGASGYDLVVPTGYIVEVLAAMDLLRPISKKYLTNWGNVATTFQDPIFDKGNKFTVPWQWGTTGLAYRSDLVKAKPDSWGVFLDPALKGKMTMMDDVRDVIGALLKLKGHSLNSTVEAELQEAKTDAIAAKALITAYISAPVKGNLIAGDVWIAQLWNGDTAQAKIEQPAIEFAMPKEGGTLWLDSLVIPKEAPHPRAAHEFMNFILRPEIGKGISDFTGYGSPNQKASDTLATPVPYPTAEELAKLEYQRDLGNATALWDRIWTEIKSS